MGVGGWVSGWVGGGSRGWLLGCAGAEKRMLNGEGGLGRAGSAGHVSNRRRSNVSSGPGATAASADQSSSVHVTQTSNITYFNNPPLSAPPPPLALSCSPRPPCPPLQRSPVTLH